VGEKKFHPYRTGHGEDHVYRRGWLSLREYRTKRSFFGEGTNFSFLMGYFWEVKKKKLEVR